MLALVAYEWIILAVVVAGIGYAGYRTFLKKKK